MADVLIRREGRAGRITLTRPQALNALTHPMCRAIESALDAWRADAEVALVILDAQGERAFCAGGDIAEVWRAGRRGDFAAGRDFWRDEYRMNAKLAAWPRPIVALMHGFTMGGGVGLGCHVRHRVVGETTQMAMPECGIGLIPDVGGTFLLSRAPGRAGVYLGLTAARMGPADAIWAGFADTFVPEADWPALVAALCATGDTAAIGRATAEPPPANLQAQAPEIDRLFAAATVPEIVAALEEDGGTLAEGALKSMRRNAPLSMVSTLAMLHARPATIRDALAQEFRWTWRSMDMGDFLEGVRAQIIDKDRNPRWQHDRPEAVTQAALAAMLAPLGANDLTFEEDGK